MKRYYAADNHYSSDTSVGFGNTWYVLVFSSRAARNDYVRNAPGMAARAIRKDEVTGYARNWHMTRNEYIEPRPFSGEYWGIREPVTGEEEGISGLVGYVEVSSPDEYYGTKPDRVFG